MSNRWIKAGLLVLTLALPVVLYLFLQEYGKNQYEVPILYAEGISPTPMGCQAQSPHKLPAFQIEDFAKNSVSESDIRGQLTVFNFLIHNCDSEAISLEGLARVSNKYRNNPRASTVSLALDSNYQVDGWQSLTTTYGLEKESWNLWRYSESAPVLAVCGFNLNLKDCDPANQLVLVDGQLRIRGYYQADDRQEIDRLITEIEILLINGEDDQSRN